MESSIIFFYNIYDDGKWFTNTQYEKYKWKHLKLNLGEVEKNGEKCFVEFSVKSIQFQCMYFIQL